jgi:ABC-2 type transport system permease protein
VFAKLALTEIKLSLREPTVAIFALAFPLILLYLLLNSFGTQPDPDFSGVNSADYYVPAYIAGTIAATGLIAIPVHLSAYRERGILRRFRASGIAPRSVLIAQILVASLIVGVGVVVMVALGNASFALSAPASWTTVIGGFVVATVVFCAVGVALASLLPSARASQAVGLVLFFGMFFISGGGPPRGNSARWNRASGRRASVVIRGPPSPGRLVARGVGRRVGRGVGVSSYRCGRRGASRSAQRVVVLCGSHICVSISGSPVASHRSNNAQQKHSARQQASVAQDLVKPRSCRYGWSFIARNKKDCCDQKECGANRGQQNPVEKGAQYAAAVLVHHIA